MKKVEIDAKEKKIGRIASQAAKSLIGKDSIHFERNKAADVEVRIVNASKAAVSEEKLVSKKYKRFSGYPGGLKEEKMGDVLRKKGYKEVIRKAVYGMLPGNKLRNERMKKLKISE